MGKKQTAIYSVDKMAFCEAHNQFILGYILTHSGTPDDEVRIYTVRYRPGFYDLRKEQEKLGAASFELFLPNAANDLSEIMKREHYAIHFEDTFPPSEKHILLKKAQAISKGLEDEMQIL